ncbi:YidH family protein [Flavobacterium sp.]|uniref:YidH family protein n=1 Tax=Flavobacterium sp. TaxID=239 RepID=UPI00403456A8
MQNIDDQTLARELLSNERTFLAWVRTGIAIMAFGFVVVKSAMFVEDRTITGAEGSIIPGELFTAIVGIVLVVAGSLITTVSYFRYRQTTRQLRQGIYHHSSGILAMVTLGVLLVSVLLIVYLIRTL